MRGNAEAKKKRVFALIAIVLTLCLVGIGALALKQGDRAEASEDVSTVDAGRSQVLLTGVSYKMDKEQEEEFEKIEKIKKEKKDTDEDEDEDDEEEFVADDDLVPDGVFEGGEEVTPAKKVQDASSSDENEEPESGESGETSDSNKKKPSDSGKQKKEKDTLPRITTSLRNGTATGTTKSFSVSAKDYKKRKISKEYFNVVANNVKLSSSGHNEFNANYDFPLKDGTNTVTITVTDKEKNSKTLTYTLNGDTSKEGADGGAITISLSSGDLQMGYFIASQKVKIYENEKLSYVVARFLENNGYGYESEGSLSSGFYLRRIKKKGMLEGWSISDELREELKKRDISIMGWDEDSLAEHDISGKSGWVYTWNDQNMNIGFSDVIAEDGDEVEISFTLFG